MPRPRRVLITAGPTHEPIDAVRYIANRSSGKLGLALAVAARQAGWHVTLLLGPTPLPPPRGVQTIRFESTSDLEKRLAVHFPGCDVLIMAAAVADYRPRRMRSSKLPRAAHRLVLELDPTPDLVAACAARKRPDQRLIGFALEEPQILALRAPEKLRRKRLDAIVANPLETMGGDRIQGVVYTRHGQVVTPPRRGTGPLTKAGFARWLVRWIDTQSRPGE